MKRASKVIARTAGGLAAVPVALAGLGVPALAGAALVVLIVVAALCWTITDAGRAGRLAMLIGAWRGAAAGQRTLPAELATEGKPPAATIARDAGAARAVL